MMDSRLLDELRRTLPSGRVSTSPEDLVAYSYDGTWLQSEPQVVAMPCSTDEVGRVLSFANRREIPVFPRGAGSGLAGGSVPNGGIALVLTLMDRVIEIDVEDRLAVVEEGVVNARLQAQVEHAGLFYPPDPASLRQSTIGGNVATAASGPRCLKYGGTREYVLGLEVVLTSGDVLQLGSRAGFGLDTSLGHLFIGSEGTLGVITQITVRLINRPSAYGTVMASFSRLDDASKAVTVLLSAGILPLALEMMDSTTMRCVEAYLRAGLPVNDEATLLIDVDGESEEVERDLEQIAEICREIGAREARQAVTEAESDDLWRARRSVSSSFGRLRPNKLGEDISVPRSAIPETVRRIDEIARRRELLIPLFGHIGDGNLHPNILCDLRDTEEMGRVSQAAEEIFSVAVAVGGTLSGEHGIGLLKREFLPSGLDPQALPVLVSLKKQLDPHGVLNPGKVFVDGNADYQPGCLAAT